jgi:hypothetical protein
MKAVTTMSTRPSLKEEPGRNSWSKVVLVALFAACLSWLAASAFIYLGSVAPAQRSVLSEEAKSLAKELDSQLKTRTAVITSLVHNRSLEKLLAATGVEHFSNAIHDQFSDFLSLEVLNANGEVLAMIGELGLSQADLSPKDAGENAFQSDQRFSSTGIFKDDPLNSSFFLTCRHGNGDGTYWYSRTRFTRKSIETLLGEVQNRAALVRISGGKHDLEVVYGHPTRTYGSWWSGPEYAEATLEYPGWLIKMTTQEKKALLSTASIFVPGSVLVLSVIGFLFGRRHWTQENFERPEWENAAAIPKENSKFVSGNLPTQNAAHEAKLLEESDFFQIDTESDFSPIKDEHCTSEAEIHDEFLPPVTEELSSEPDSASETVSRDIPSEAVQLEATDADEDEFVTDSCEEDLVVVTCETSESSTEEKSMVASQEDEIEVLWEQGAEPTIFQIAAEGKLLPENACDADKLNPDALPDVLELEWAEPKASPLPEPKEKRQRETVLLSDFFNC